MIDRIKRSWCLLALALVSQRMSPLSSCNIRGVREGARLAELKRDGHVKSRPGPWQERPCRVGIAGLPAGRRGPSQHGLRVVPPLRQPLGRGAIVPSLRPLTASQGKSQRERRCSGASPGVLGLSPPLGVLLRPQPQPRCQGSPGHEAAGGTEGRPAGGRQSG